MSDLNFLLICLVIAACAGAFAWSYFFGPRGVRAQKQRGQLRELEIKLKMSRGMDAVNTLQEISALHMSLTNIYEADKYMERAVKAAEGEFGTANPVILPVLREHLRLMEKMKRKEEAKRLKKRIKEMEG